MTDNEEHGSSFQRSCLPRLLPSVSFNDKKTPVSPEILKGKNALIRLPFRRHSNDNLEPDPCMYFMSVFLSHLWINLAIPLSFLYFPQCSSSIPEREIICAI